ncbi:MAG TPA: protein-glutamate O-methyltransferase CheR [Bryobacteraceae bacterium]|jgi:chemotaxis protein methyltransferase CheR
MSKEPPASGAAPFEVAELPPRIFQKISSLIYDKAGIELKNGKQALVSARLGKKLRETGCRSYEEYLSRIEGDGTGESLIALIDALTTNYTSFLRERSHFDYLRKILPPLSSRGAVDIWCAAASTGEEPYTLAISAAEALGSEAYARCRILATDISTRVLATARRGIYPAERMAEIPKDWLAKYWLRGEGSSQGMCKVKPEIGRMVEFRRLNLIEEFSLARPFPVVFCRNVMIYFDKSTQERVVSRISRFIEPGGYLFVGHSESLSGIAHGLECVAPAVYQKRGTQI